MNSYVKRERIKRGGTPNSYFLQNNVEKNMEQKPFSDRFFNTFFQQTKVAFRPAPEQLRALFKQDEIASNDIMSFIGWDVKKGEHVMKYREIADFLKELGFSNVENFGTADYTFYSAKGAVEYAKSTWERECSINETDLDARAIQERIECNSITVNNPFGGVLCYFD